MPNYKVRTYEENREVVADKLEFCPDGIRFYTGDKVTAAFSRYLWVQEEPAAETLPEASEAPLPLPTPEPAPDTQPE
ncbi:MAG: hypothetical protein C0411_01115 [Pseudomonas sp.]|nr:hypothetical protein [Pseudomonas sp.]